MTDGCADPFHLDTVPSVRVPQSPGLEKASRGTQAGRARSRAVRLARWGRGRRPHDPARRPQDTCDARHARRTLSMTLLLPVTDTIGSVCSEIRPVVRRRLSRGYWGYTGKRAGGRSSRESYRGRCGSLREEPSFWAFTSGRLGSRFEQGANPGSVRLRHGPRYLVLHLTHPHSQFTTLREDRMPVPSFFSSGSHGFFDWACCTLDWAMDLPCYFTLIFQFEFNIDGLISRLLCNLLFSFPISKLDLQHGKYGLSAIPSRLFRYCDEERCTSATCGLLTSLASSMTSDLEACFGLRFEPSTPPDPRTNIPHRYLTSRGSEDFHK